MQGRRILLILALVALYCSTALAQQNSNSTGKDNSTSTSKDKSSRQSDIKTRVPCHSSCSCSGEVCPDGTDTSSYGDCVEVLPRCPVPHPAGVPPDVRKQVERTITVLFFCDFNLWDDLTAEQQRPFRNGTYVPAEEIDPELLDAFNLLSSTNSSAPLPGLEAILYLEEFEQWQILAESKEDLNDIITRVTSIQPEESNRLPQNVTGLRQAGRKKPSKRRPKSIVRNTYHKTRARTALRAEQLESSMRQLLQATTNDPLFPEQYHLQTVDAPEAWELTRGNKSVVIAVVDTGCDINHPDLMRNIWINKGEDANDGIDNDGNGIVDDINGANFINTQVPNDLTDVNGHGTHVAGIIGARGNNNIGMSGVMQRAALMCLKSIVGNTEPGPNPAFGPVDAAVRAWQYALRKGARIINNSWGTDFVLGNGETTGLTSRTSEAYAAEIERFERPLKRLQQARILNVWAAGNDGSDIDPPNPTTSPNTVLSTLRNIDNDVPGPVNLQLVVVSTQQNEDISPFSNFGDLETDLGAPGSLILSTAPTNPSELFPDACTGVPADFCTVSDGIINFYGYLSGTSQAAPIVSGTAGLCLSVLEPCHRHDATQIAYDCILASVDETEALQGRTGTGGRVNARATSECCLQYCDRKPGDGKKTEDKTDRKKP